MSIRKIIGIMAILAVMASGRAAQAQSRLVIVPHRAIARQPLIILVGSSTPVGQVSVRLSGTPITSAHLHPKYRGHQVYQAHFTPPHLGTLRITASSTHGKRVAAITVRVSPAHAVPTAQIATIALLVLGGIFLWQRTRAR